MSRDNIVLLLKTLICTFLHTRHHKVIKDKALCHYCACTKCNRRWIVDDFVSGYYPIDKQWIETGTFTKVLPPDTCIAAVKKRS